MEARLVVDASLAFKWLITEHDTAVADKLAQDWNAAGIQLLAPPLLLAELANGIHRRIRDDHMKFDDGLKAFARILAFQVEITDTSALWGRALEVASELGQDAVYDSIYLALAESLDCQLWTADGRFYRAARDHHPRVHWLGEVASPG